MTLTTYFADMQPEERIVGSYARQRKIQGCEDVELPYHSGIPTRIQGVGMYGTSIGRLESADKPKL